MIEIHKVTKSYSQFEVLNAESEAIQKLAEVMTSEAVRDFLQENYDETAISAF